jgi:hypothetical protein
MFSLLAGLLYLAALVVPLYLVLRFHPLAWPWHVLAILAAAGVGLAPPTPLLNSVAGTFLYGFVFFFLMTWGIGGICIAVLRHPRQVGAKAH